MTTRAAALLSTRCRCLGASDEVPMIRKPDSRDNLHSAHPTLQPLGVEWMQWQHRAALAHDKISAYSGNMKSVHVAPYR
jgi:hypothetical protein